MKKHLKLIPFIIILLLAVGCGKKDTIVTSELSTQIAESVMFSEQLMQIDNRNIEKRYSLNSKDYKEVVAFTGTLSVCDEYLIVKTDAPDTVKEKLEKYVSNKRKEYETYRPDEVAKLDSAVIESHNDSVVLIITADSEKALAVYKEYVKK